LSGSVLHATQRPLAVSHTGPPGFDTQSALVEHGWLASDGEVSFAPDSVVASLSPPSPHSVFEPVAHATKHAESARTAACRVRIITR
jgi:hypothetical protein